MKLEDNALVLEVAGLQVRLGAAELSRLVIERLTQTTTPAVQTSVRGGEHWNGGIFAGVTVHNSRPMGLVLLPAEEIKANWQRAGEWATEQGGVLPSRIDALVLYESLRAHFKTDGYYWTDTVRPGNADCAFIQDFEFGIQSYAHKVSAYRARAVRRVAI